MVSPHAAPFEAGCGLKAVLFNTVATPQIMSPYTSQSTSIEYLLRPKRPRCGALKEARSADAQASLTSALLERTFLLARDELERGKDGVEIIRDHTEFALKALASDHDRFAAMYGPVNQITHFKLTFGAGVDDTPRL